MFLSSKHCDHQSCSCSISIIKYCLCMVLFSSLNPACAFPFLRRRSEYPLRSLLLQYKHKHKYYHIHHRHHHHHHNRHTAFTKSYFSNSRQNSKTNTVATMTLLSQREYSSPSSSPLSEEPMNETTTTNKETTTSTTKLTAKAKAKLIPSTAESLKDAGERLRSGLLVSFPTETVYGLGCHALDAEAVQRVFRAKERPLTDPLIVHVNQAQSALKLWDASSSESSPSSSSESSSPEPSSQQIEQRALEALSSAFWPGPLTIVARANTSLVPSIIMANTGYVACRSPSHPVARSLIEASGVPIAAPSANKFGHVSPTRACHVLDDLGMEDVWIVDPNLNSNSNLNSDLDLDTNGHEKNNDIVICDVGVESTVAKVEYSSCSSSNDSDSDNGDQQQQQQQQQQYLGSVTILRHGAVSQLDITNCLKEHGLEQYFHVSSKKQATGESVNHVAPGQTIRHYSPNVQSFMISPELYNRKENNNNNNNNNNNKEGSISSILSQEEVMNLQTAVIIDFGKKLEFLKDGALAYRDLSPSGDSSVAAAKVFDTLRWSETVDGAKRVYFPEIVVVEKIETDQQGNNNNDDDDDALVLAVKDRLTRAASGVVVNTLI